MIWRYWPLRALQGELGSDLLDKLRNTIPLIDPDGRGVFFETEKESLEKLLAAFSPEDYFRKKSNVRRCLEYLPKDKFESLLEESGLPKISQSSSDFEDIARRFSNTEKLNNILLDFFNLPSRFRRAKKQSSSDKFICQPPSSDHPALIKKPYKVLKDYQTQIFLTASGAMAAPMSRLILQMPTGSGKTRTAMEVIASFLNEEPGKPSTVVWLANSKELCDQAIACFVEIWEHVGLRPVEISRSPTASSTERESHSDGAATLVVSSFQKFWSEISSPSYPGCQVFSVTDLLVVDEAHIAVARTYEAVIRELISGSNCRLLGLTATPGRTEMAETTQLSELFHGNIVSLEDPSGTFENVIAYLRSKGVLSGVQYELLEIHESKEVSDQDAAKANLSEEFSDRLLKQIGQDEYRNAQIIARVIPDLESGLRGLLFAPSIDASKFITSMLLFLGYRVAHVDGALSPDTRDSIIRDYMSGELDLICNYGVLATGFDAPKTDFLCIARPTKSPVLYSQMLGRGLRGPSVGGTQLCKIVEVRDTYINMGLQDQLYRFFEDYWGA